MSVFLIFMLLMTGRLMIFYPKISFKIKVIELNLFFIKKIKA